MKDLKNRAIRGGLAKGGAQATNFLLKTGCLIIFARLLDPTDFGLVGMVTAITGALSIFREFGLSLATVQRAEITDEQTSTLFWINVAVGVVLCLISIAVAPIVASFYREPRLSLIMVVLGTGFLFNAVGIQHSALLQRQLRFTALAFIDVLALVISSVISAGLAFQGYGYWALVAWSVILPLATSLLLWFHSKWIPGRPSLSVGTGSMVRFGSIVTLNSLVVYVAFNLDKVMLGRFWGAEVVGIYGRGYQLVTLPNDQINGTIGGIAISVLSRLQGDPKRLWAYFRKGYSLFLAVTFPIAIMCALFAEEIVLVMLGPKWSDAIPIFRLLVPVVLVLAVINPPGWLLVALGKIERSLYVALVLAPIVMTGCAVGALYGAKGVAIGFSAAMMLWVVPHLVWCFRGTEISLADVLRAIGQPTVAGMAGGLFAYGVLLLSPHMPPLLTLTVGGALFMTVYAWVLLFIMKQKVLFLDVFRAFRGRSDDKALALS